MNTDDELLIDIMADTDAVFAPIRCFDAPRPATIYFARRQFRSVGVDYSSGGSSVAERKEAERSLVELRNKGLIRVHRPRGRSLAVQLTDDADMRARAMAGLPGLEDAVMLLRSIAQRSKRPAKLFSDVWIRECDLCGVEWGDQLAYDAFRLEAGCTPFLLIEEMILPALVRGWITANSDGHNRAYYALTPAGWIRAEQEDNDIAADLPTCSEEARRQYYARMKRTLGRLGTVPPLNTSEIGYAHLPVSNKGLTLFSMPIVDGPAPEIELEPDEEQQTD